MAYNKSAPLRVGGENVWKGQDRTNGFVMRSVDGRVPALKESFTNIIPHFTDADPVGPVAPFGCGLWRDARDQRTERGTVYVDSGGTGSGDSVFAGILEFNQGITTGHPVANVGLQAYMKGEVVISGLVGYKSFMPQGDLVTSMNNYAAWLADPHNPTLDLATHRMTYQEVLTEMDAGGVEYLGLGIHSATGFPHPLLLRKTAGVSYNASPTDFYLVGLAEVFEPENETIYFRLDRFVVDSFVEV